MDCTILASSGKFEKLAINPGVRQNSGQADPVKNGFRLPAVCRYQIFGGMS